MSARREECIHELDPRTCSVCSGRDREPPAGPANFGPWFSSMYPGKCAGCGDEFGVRDRIRADGDGGYLCGSCGERTT